MVVDKASANEPVTAIMKKKGYKARGLLVGIVSCMGIGFAAFSMSHQHSSSTSSRTSVDDGGGIRASVGMDESLSSAHVDPLYANVAFKMEGTGNSNYDGYYGLGYERKFVALPREQTEGRDIDIVSPTEGWGQAGPRPWDDGRVKIFYKLKKDTYDYNGHPIVQFLQQTYPVVAIYTFTNDYPWRMTNQWYMHEEGSNCVLWTQPYSSSVKPLHNVDWYRGEYDINTDSQYFPYCKQNVEHRFTPYTVYL